MTARWSLDAAQCKGVEPFPAGVAKSPPYTPTSSFTICFQMSQIDRRVVMTSVESVGYAR